MDFDKIRESVPTLIKLAKYGNRSLDNELAEAFVLSEIDELEYLLEGNNYLQGATESSALKVLRTTLKMGLSVDKNANMVYVTAGKNTTKNCVELNVQVTTEGELFLATKAGLITSCDMPYREGDEYVFSFIKGDGTKETIKKGWDFFKRLMDYSSKKNNGKANKLYGTDIDSIDAGFAATKLVKHAIKRIGVNPMNSEKKVIDATNYKPLGLVGDEFTDEMYEEVTSTDVNNDLVELQDEMDFEL